MNKSLSRLCAAMGAGTLLISVAGMASQAAADDVHNTIDASVDSTAEVITLTAGGANGTVTLAIKETGTGANPADGKSGCNLTGSTTLTVSVSSSNTGVATVTSSNLTFTSCSDTKTLTITPVAAGTSNVTVSQSTNTTGATFNFAPAAFTVNVDPSTPPNTPPVLTVPSSPVVAEATSSAGATVNYSVSATDAQDDPDPTPLCAPASGTVFPIGDTTVNCAVTDSGGLSDSDSFTVRVQDTTDPTVNVSTTATQAASGWYNIASSGTSGIEVTVTASDAVGVADVTCTPAALDLGSPITLTDGVHNVSCTAVDGAGNDASDSETYQVDQTKPTITGDRNPAANGYGWNNVNVVVTFNCTDGTSGVASSDVAGETVSSEVADYSVTNTGSCTDNAGNVADSATVTGISIDKTNPVISGSASPAPNGAGWNNTDVEVSFTCADTGSVQSGIATDTVLDATLSSDGAGQSATSTGDCVDEADNAATAATVSGINIDQTPPVVSVTGVTDGATYTLGSVPAADCSTTDATSGVKNYATPSSSGGPVGAVTVSCTGALDNADNPGSASATYNVIYAWSGFFQPIDNTPAGGPIVFNKAKAGQSIPAKFSLGGNQGLNIIEAGYPKVTQITCSTTASVDLIETYASATANNGLVYDATANQYNYVWKTPTTNAGKCYKFDLALIDGTHHVAYFQFTK